MNSPTMPDPTGWTHISRMSEEDVEFERAVREAEAEAERIPVWLTREQAALLQEEADTKGVVLRGDRWETINPNMKIWLEARIALWTTIAEQLREADHA